MADTKEILALAVEIADTMLRSGAEIYRVEDSVIHIFEAYGLEDFDVYVLSNGIFTTGDCQPGQRGLPGAGRGSESKIVRKG